MVEASIKYNVTSPFLNLPKTEFYIKRENSEVEHIFDMLLEMTPQQEDTKVSYILVILSFNQIFMSYIKMLFKHLSCSTTFKPVNTCVSNIIKRD